MVDVLIRGFAFLYPSFVCRILNLWDVLSKVTNFWNLLIFVILGLQLLLTALKVDVVRAADSALSQWLHEHVVEDVPNVKTSILWLLIRHFI